MKYSVFSAFSKGYAHVKENMPCQDYADHYCDKQGRFVIAVACDGHSDKNCFRSDRGAKFGCEATIEILKTFFESFYTLDEDDRRRNLENEDWTEKSTEMIKKYFIPCWNQKVQEDLEREPFTDENLAPLTQRIRDLYKAGKYTRSIYGATLQACAVCEDFHLIMQIGDGVILALYPDGCYDEPLPEDEKSNYGEPASICDEDLLSRQDAFRIRIIPGIPVGMFATSDGMGDIPRLTLISALRSAQEKIAMPDDPEDGLKEISDSQQAYIQDMVAYYAAKDHGPEDDCSISGFVLRDAEIAPIRLMKTEAEEIVSDAEKRLRKEENRIFSAEQNRNEYLREARDHIQQQEMRRERLIAELEKVQNDIAQLQQRIAQEETGLEERDRKILESLREHRKKAEEYLLNSRTKAGEPIPHGVLLNRIAVKPQKENLPGEKPPEDDLSAIEPMEEQISPQTDTAAAPAEESLKAEPQDKPEAAAPVNTKLEEENKPVEEQASDRPEELLKAPSENAEKLNEAGTTAEEPKQKNEEDPDAFTFPLPPGKIIGQTEIPAAEPVEPVASQTVQQSVPQTPLQPVQQSLPQLSQKQVRQSPEQQPAAPVHVPEEPKPQDTPVPQQSVSSSKVNMYVVPDDQLLTP